MIEKIAEVYIMRKTRKVAEDYARSFDADRAEQGYLPLRIAPLTGGFAVVETGRIEVSEEATGR